MVLFYYIFVLAVTAFFQDITMAEDPQLKKTSNELAEANNKFALDLYQAVRYTGHNIAVSPISVQIVLGMALQGARGKTAEEIYNLLHIPGYSNDILLESQRNIIARLNDTQLSLGTKIYVDDSIELNPDYQAAMIEYFRSYVEGLDFKGNPSDAVNTINNWVKEKTNRKIEEIITKEMINDMTRLVLINAVHFKASWRKQFKPKDTEIRPFYPDGRSRINVTMMKLLDEKFRYMESKTLEARIVEVPYDGFKYSMLVMLPNERDGLNDLENRLANVNLTEELKGLKTRVVNLKLPKFKLEQTLDLSDILKKLGIPTAFEAAADFSGITDEKVSISNIVHKTFIEVNEEGTEAAAATALGMYDVSYESEHKEIFATPALVCNRPFILIIMHCRFGVVYIARTLLADCASEDEIPNKPRMPTMESTDSDSS